MARPKGMRRGRYRMTPARRAALRKAQLMSARRRRRKTIARGVGKTAVNIGGLFLAARVSTYIAKPGRFMHDVNHVKGLFGKKPKTNSSVPNTLKTAQVTWIPRNG